MRTCVLVCVVVLIASSQPARALETGWDKKPPEPTAQTRALATALVDASVDREQFVKRLEPFEKMLSGMIASRVAPHDPTASAKVATVVHEGLSPVPGKIMEGLVDAYSTTYSAQELSDVLVFLKGPGGHAEKTNLPLLKGDLSAAFSGAADSEKAVELGEQAFAQASPARQELILRIFRAQDLEARTRKGLGTLGKIMDAAIANTGPAKPDQSDRRSDPDKAAASEKEARVADDYVRTVMAVEKGFYATHYSDSELKAAAEYLESKSGQAMLVRSPAVQRASAHVMQTQLAKILPTLNVTVCSTVACSPEQRSSLADLISSLGKMMGPMLGAVAG